jgi:hypothetical protein
VVGQGLLHPDVVVEQWPPRQVKTKRRKQKNWRVPAPIMLQTVKMRISTLRCSTSSNTRVPSTTGASSALPIPPRILRRSPSSQIWFLKDLKRGEIEQVCVLTAEAPSVDAPPDATVDSVASSVSDTPGKHERPEGAEPKSARAERFPSQSWEALQASGNPLNALAREYGDVFPEKIQATLPADCGV